MKNTEALLPLCFFRFVQQFPESGQEQQNTKQFFQKYSVQCCTEPGKNGGRSTTGNDCWKHGFPVEVTLPPPEAAGDQCRRDKEQQIDCPRCIRSHFQCDGKPQNQKTASADSDSGQKTEYRTHNQCHGQRI